MDALRVSVHVPLCIQISLHASMLHAVDLLVFDDFYGLFLLSRRFCVFIALLSFVVLFILM